MFIRDFTCSPTAFKSRVSSVVRSTNSMNFGQTKQKRSDTFQIRFGIDLKQNNVDGITLGYIGPDSKPIPMSNRLVNKLFMKTKGIKITQWPVFAMGPRSLPLQTYGMCNCAALSIDGSNAHYLMHLNPGPYEEDLIKHFKEDIPFDLKDKEIKIRIIPGTSDGTDTSVRTILDALKGIHPDLPKKVQFIHFPDDATKYGPNHGIRNPVSIVSVFGQLFCHPLDNNNLSNEERPHFEPGGKSIRPHIVPIAT
jgi:hypothetical protein